MRVLAPARGLFSVGQAPAPLAPVRARAELASDFGWLIVPRWFAQFGVAEHPSCMTLKSILAARPGELIPRLIVLAITELVAGRCARRSSRLTDRSAQLAALAISLLADEATAHGASTRGNVHAG